MKWDNKGRMESRQPRGCHRPFVSSLFPILLRQKPLSSNVPLACSWPLTFSFCTSPITRFLLTRKVTVRSRLIPLQGRNQLIRPTFSKPYPHSSLRSKFRVVLFPFDNLRLLTLEELATSIPRSKEEDVLSRFLQIVWSIRHRVWEFHQGVTRKRKRQGDRERERAWPYPRLPSLSLDPLSEGCTNIKVKFLALSFLLAERDRFNQKKKEWGGGKKDIPDNRCWKSAFSILAVRSRPRHYFFPLPFSYSFKSPFSLLLREPAG